MSIVVLVFDRRSSPGGECKDQEDDCKHRKTNRVTIHDVTNLQTASSQHEVFCFKCVRDEVGPSTSIRKESQTTVAILGGLLVRENLGA